MNQEQLKQFIMSLPEAVEVTPFGATGTVYKVRHKTFATLSQNKDSTDYWLSVKSDPDKALKLRKAHEEVVAGLQMNKKHWNSIQLNNKLTEPQLKQLIEESFCLVLDGMSNENKAALYSQLNEQDFAKTKR